MNEILNEERASARRVPVSVTLEGGKMSPSQLVPGQAYYRLTYADQDMTIPGVEPMIFVGANIFPDDEAASPTYYFQDTISFQRFGDATKYAGSALSPEDGFITFYFKATELRTSLVNLEGAIEALESARARAANRLGQ